MTVARPKFKPQNLIMAEAVPFAQRWTYHSTDPIEEIMKPSYYKVEERRFRVGDSLRVIELKGKEKVIAFADLLVVECNPMRFVTTGEPMQVIAKPKTVRVAQGKNCWELFEGDDLISDFPTKKAAEDAMRAYTG